MSATNPTNPGPANVDAARSFTSNATGGDRGFQYLMSDDDGRADFIANASSLQHEEWKQISDTVIRVREQNFNLIDNLRSQGLTKDLSLATFVDLWHTVSDIDGAEVAMNPQDTGDEDGVEYELDGAPLPVVHKDWSIDRRQLLSSRQSGTSLDTLVPAMMTREVSKKIEQLAFNGWAPNVDGYQMYGFTNHPNRNTYTGSDWDDGTSDASQIRGDILAMIESLENDEFGTGTYDLYLNRNEYQTLRSQVDDIGDGSQNIRQRILEEFGQELNRIEQSPFVPAGEAIMFTPTDEVVQVGVAEDVQPIEWEAPHGWSINMKVFGAMNVELRSTQAGQMGVVHTTGI